MVNPATVALCEHTHWESRSGPYLPACRLVQKHADQEELPGVIVDLLLDEAMR